MGLCWLQTCTAESKTSPKSSQTSSLLYVCAAKGILTGLDITFTIEKGVLCLLQVMTGMPPRKSEKQKAIHISCCFLSFKLKLITLQDRIPKHHLDPATPYTAKCPSLTAEVTLISCLSCLGFGQLWSSKGPLSSNFLEKSKSGDELCKPY